MPRNSKATTSKSATSRSKGQTSASGNSSEASKLKELFVEELKDIYWAEKHLLKALPKMAKAATSEEVANAFTNHLAQTEEQVGRVEQVFEILEMPARAKKCEAMEGLVMEAQQAIEDDWTPRCLLDRMRRPGIKADWFLRSQKKRFPVTPPVPKTTA